MDPSIGLIASTTLIYSTLPQERGFADYVPHDSVFNHYGAQGFNRRIVVPNTARVVVDEDEHRAIAFRRFQIAPNPRMPTHGPASGLLHPAAIVAYQTWCQVWCQRRETKGIEGIRRYRESVTY